MAVAKTYAKMKISGEPFKENGRMYVNVLAPKGLKKVRWYSDAEYRRMYPQEGIEYNDTHMDFNARHAFGFGELGYITIYRGDEGKLQECVENHHECFRRNLTFNYYTPSHINVCDLPDGIEPIRLTWEEVKEHDNQMKSHEEVRKYVNGLLILDGNSTSQYQGSQDEWLQKIVRVTKKTTKESRYGTKYTYNLVDAEDNIYVWETGAKDYACDKTVSLKMKVKEHKEIDGNKVTVVWYCKEV